MLQIITTVYVNSVNHSPYSHSFEARQTSYIARCNLGSYEETKQGFKIHRCVHSRRNLACLIAFLGSSIVLMTNSSRKNLTARRRTYSINLHVDKASIVSLENYLLLTYFQEPFFDKEMMTRGVSFMPPVMKESDIQQLMKILEETVEHVEEPEKSASGPNFQNYAVPSNVSPDLRSSILSESVSLPANCFLPEI